MLHGQFHNSRNNDDLSLGGNPYVVDTCREGFDVEDGVDDGGCVMYRGLACSHFVGGRVVIDQKTVFVDTVSPATSRRPVAITIVNV